MKYLLTFALFFATNLYAITTDQFCSQFTWDNEKIECFKTVSGKFVFEPALNICQSFSFDNDKMNCLRTILNKNYSAGEVRTCANMAFESEKVNCLAQLGNRYDPIPPRDPRFEDIRKLSITGLDALRFNDLNTVYRVLNQINQLTSRP